jgi:hypothetical protein
MEGSDMPRTAYVRMLRGRIRTMDKTKQTGAIAFAEWQKPEEEKRRLNINMEHLTALKKG